MAYDLLERPSGYRTDTVLLVAPYFDTQFIAELLERLKPRRVLALIDDNQSTSTCEALGRACVGKTKFRYALGKASGLVHAKLYYAEFVKREGRKRRKRQLVFGSANATHSGFCGTRNAELLASVSLRAGDDDELLTYLTSIAEAVDRCDGRIHPVKCEQLSCSPLILFPGFRVSAPTVPSGFDTWMQRGVLVAKHRDPQQFLKLNVKLKKVLPEDAVAGAFKADGWLAVGARNAVRQKYVGKRGATVIDIEEMDSGDDPTVKSWKAKYCIWTHLGDWVSDECFAARSAGMVSAASAERAADVEELLLNAGNKQWRSQRVRQFLDELDRTWAKLPDPSSYLQSNSGGVDRQYYGSSFEKKIERDLLLSKDANFKRRYVSGYEFLRVPQFRQDESAWNDFVLSFCETLSIEVPKKGSRSSLAKAVRRLADAGILKGYEPEEILSGLRTDWENAVTIKRRRTTVREQVIGYHSGI